MNRRSMIKTTTGAGLGLIVTSQIGCDKKNLSVYVQTVVGALKELSPLLPAQAQNIAKAISIAETFDKAYRDGKLANAMALFANLSDLLTQIVSDVGVNNPTVKVALAVAGIAIRAIAVLLQSQANQPAVASAVRSASPEAQRQIKLIERLADQRTINKLFAETF